MSDSQPSDPPATTNRVRENEALRQQLTALEHDRLRLQARLDEAQAVAKVGIWETDLATMEIHWSDQTHRIFGTDPASFRPTFDGFLALVHPDDRDRLATALQESMRTREAQAIEHRTFLPGSTVKIVEERWQVLFDDDDKPLRAIGTCQDVTERKEAEAAMQRALQRLHEAQRIGGIGDWEWDLATQRIAWSPEIFALVGRDPRDGPPRDYDEMAAYFDEESRARMKARLVESIETGELREYELVGTRANGRPIIAQARAVPRMNAKGVVAGMYGTFQDITERRVAELALSRREALLRIAGRVARIGGWSIDLPENAVRWSDEMFDILELPHGQAPSLADGLALYCEPGRQEVVAAVETCARTGAPFDLEIEMLTGRGRRLWVRVSGEAEREADGSIARLHGFLQDISSLRVAEQSLAESQHRFRQLADAMPFIVWTADPDGTVDFVNRRYYEYSGLPTDAPPAESWPALVHPEDAPAVARAWEEGVRSDETFEIEYRLRRGTDGAHRWFRTQAQPVRDASRRLVKWYGSEVDIHETKQLQQAATRLADRLATTLESITDAFCTYDRAWRFTYVNREAERMLRRRREDLLGRSVWQTFPETVGTAFEREYRRSRDEHVATTFEFYYSALNAWFEVRCFPSEEGLAAYFRDITAARAADQALRESETRYRLLFADSPQPMWVFDRETLRFLAVNDAAVEHYGYSSDEFLAMTVIDLRAPEDAIDFERARALVPASGREAGYRQHRKKDGTVVEMEVVSDSLEFNGRPARIVLANDVTQRRRAEAKIREQAALLDQAQDAIFVCDMDHRVLYWNRSAERVYRWSAEAMAGRSVRETLQAHPADFDRAFKTLLEAGEWVGELEQRRSDGVKLTIEARWTLLRDAKGRPSSLLAINTDVTERRKLEQQFFRAQRMESIGTLAGGIAHDLNNLLAPITMGVALLRDAAKDRSSRELIDSIERSASRGADLVKQVLSFARGVEGARVPVQIARALRELESIVENTFPKNLRMQIEAAGDLRPVLGDPTQIHQVLLNLCVNARDAMPAGGELTLRAANVEIDLQYATLNRNVDPGRYVRIDVVDTGSGMPPEVVERIFEPFFTTKEVGSGTGLGLSTVIGIVRSHGGFINVYSEVGQGSTFRVHLPAHEADGAPADEPPPAERIERGRGELVLVVDDEATIRSVTKQTLEAFGYRVLTADDGAQAVALYAQHRQDIALVLTDMMMPVMDGPAMIAALRRIAPRLPIVAASGLNANGHVARAAGAGVRHFLAKPYSAESLVRTIRKVLDEAAERPAGSHPPVVP